VKLLAKGGEKERRRRNDFGWELQKKADEYFSSKRAARGRGLDRKEEAGLLPGNGGRRYLNDYKEGGRRLFGVFLGGGVVEEKKWWTLRQGRTRGGGDLGSGFFEGEVVTVAIIPDERGVEGEGLAQVASVTERVLEEGQKVIICLQLFPGRKERRTLEIQEVAMQGVDGSIVTKKGRAEKQLEPTPYFT